MYTRKYKLRYPNKRAFSVMENIMKTPGIVDHKIENGILVIKFDDGTIVDMTVPEVVEPPVDIATFFD